MKKLFLISLLLLVGISVSVSCYGANEDRGSHFSDGVYSTQKYAADAATGLCIETSSGEEVFRVLYDGTVRIGASGTTTWQWDTPGEYRQVNLDNQLWINIGENEEIATGAGSTPHLILTSATVPSYINYLTDANTERLGNDCSPIAISFRVPDDYRGSPEVQLFARNVQAGSTPNYIDFEYGEYSDGDVIATDLYDGTEAAVGIAGSVTVETVTLTLSDTYVDAGDYVTVHVWPVCDALDSNHLARAATSSNAATTDLRIYGGAFRYIAQW